MSCGRWVTRGTRGSDGCGRRRRGHARRARSRARQPPVARRGRGRRRLGRGRRRGREPAVARGLCASSSSRRATGCAPSEYSRLTPGGMLRRTWREAGLSAALGVGNTPFISVLQGKCVGGSSVLTGGVCFRIPDEVLHEWSHDLGLRHDDAGGRRPELRRGRARRARRDGARPHAIAQHGALRRRRREDGHPDEVDAPQHLAAAAASRAATSAAPTAPSSASTSRSCPTPAPTGPPSSATRSSSASTSRGGMARGVRGRLLDADGEHGRSVRGPREARGRRVRLAAHPAPAARQRRGLAAPRTSPDAAPRLPRRRHLRRGGRGLGRLAAERLQRSLRRPTASPWSASSLPRASSPRRSPAWACTTAVTSTRCRNLAVFGGMIHDEGGGRGDALAGARAAR